jgi:hypothetical protein
MKYLILLATLLSWNKVWCQIDIDLRIDDVNANVSDSVLKQSLENSINLLNGTLHNFTVANHSAQIIPCPTGYYCIANLTEAIACPEGTYQPYINMTQATDCLPCPQGAKCPRYGLAAYESCSPGTYQNQLGQLVCIDCPQGNMCNNTGHITPTNCTPGTYQNQMRQTTCIDCPMGNMCNNTGHITPTNCSVGTYQNQMRQTTCIDCPQGKLCDTVGHVNPTNCTPGTFQNQTRQSVCLACLEGYMCPNIAQINPDPCQIGRYQNETSQTICPLCPSGTKCSNLGQIQPEDCGTGYYQTEQGQNVCIDCPAGAYCPIVRTVSPTQCPITTYQPFTRKSLLSDCAICMANSYCTLPTFQEACPIGTFSLAGSKSQLDCRCQAGYYCQYKEMVTAVISLNISLSAWNDNTNQIQTKLKNAIAAAAGVTSDKVYLGNARSRSGRRLLSTHDMIDIVANVMDTREIKNLDSEIQQQGLFSNGHIWSENHLVLKKHSKPNIRKPMEAVARSNS